MESWSPRIQGRAYITGRTTLYFDPLDPFAVGSTSGAMPAPDVLVVGAGIVGAACAPRRRERALSVRVLESRFAGGGAPRQRWATSSVMDDSPASSR